MKKLMIVGLSLVAGFAQADKVVLMSGSHLTGEAGLIQGGKLMFKSDDLGDVQIDVAKIKSLDVEKSHVIQYTDNSTEEKVLGIHDGVLWTGNEKLDMAPVKATDPVPETWHGRINAGYNATRGNTYDDSATVVANINRRWEKDRLNVDFGYYYGKQGTTGEDAKRTTDRWEAEAKHDHFWFPKIYHYENLKWERDTIQELNARYRLGLGAGYQWLDNTEFETTGVWSFNQEVGANWIKEEYKENDDAKGDGFAALRYGHHLDYVPKWAKTVECFHNLEVLPDVAEWDKFLAKADVGLSTKIFLDLDLLMKIEWDYNSKPAKDRKKTDTRYIIGLGYKW